MATVASGNPVGRFGQPSGGPMASRDVGHASNVWQPSGQLDDRHPGALDPTINVQDVDRSRARFGGQRTEQARDATVRQRHDVEIIVRTKGPDQDRESASEPSKVVVEEDVVLMIATGAEYPDIFPRRKTGHCASVTIQRASTGTRPFTWTVLQRRVPENSSPIGHGQRRPPVVGRAGELKVQKTARLRPLRHDQQAAGRTVWMLAYDKSRPDSSAIGAEVTDHLGVVLSGCLGHWALLVLGVDLAPRRLATPIDCGPTAPARAAEAPLGVEEHSSPLTIRAQRQGRHTRPVWPLPYRRSARPEHVRSAGQSAPLTFSVLSDAATRRHVVVGAVGQGALA